jgi:hypothetical protein
LAEYFFFIPDRLSDNSQDSLRCAEVGEFSEQYLGAGILFRCGLLPKTADSGDLPCKVRWGHDEGEDLLWKAGKKITNRLGALDDEGAFLGSYSFVLNESA